MTTDTVQVKHTPWESRVWSWRGGGDVQRHRTRGAGVPSADLPPSHRTLRKNTCHHLPGPGATVLIVCVQAIGGRVLPSFRVNYSGEWRGRYLIMRKDLYEKSVSVSSSVSAPPPQFYSFS